MAEYLNEIDEEDARMAYPPGSPKHPDYAGARLDAADEQRKTDKERVFTGRYQCPKCLAVRNQGGLCFCGGRRFPLFRKARVARR